MALFIIVISLCSVVCGCEDIIALHQSKSGSDSVKDCDNLHVRTIRGSDEIRGHVYVGVESGSQHCCMNL